MRFGRTSLHSKGLMAPGRRRRKLRSDMRVSEQVVAGEKTFMVKVDDHVYLRFPELAWSVLQTFDGTRTESEVLEVLRETDPDLELSLEELEEFIGGTDPGVWEKTGAARNLAVLEKIRKERSERASDANLFYMYFSAWDPNAFFDRVVPYLRWIWTRPFVVASLVLVAIGASLFVADFDRILQDASRFYSVSGKGFADARDFWILLLIVGFIHECAHGLTCKNSGGEVHQMGFLLIYFTPAFYTDVTDLLLFERLGPRLWTIFAGIWIETVLCAVSLIVWSVTAAGTFVNDWAYKFMLMTSITGVILNLNPLMKFDGYLVLCELLRMDSLREDSFEYLGKWARRVVSGGRVPVERPDGRTHWILLSYGMLAILYSTLVIVLVVLWVEKVSLEHLGPWGWVVVALVVWLLLRKRVAGAALWARQQLPQAKEAVMNWRPTPQQARLLAVAGLFLALVPLRERVTTDFVLEPSARAELRAQVDGIVRAVPVREDQLVAAGTLLAVLHNPDLETRAEVVGHELRLAEQQLRAAQSHDEDAVAQAQGRERQRLRAEHEMLQVRRSLLEIRAPLDGTLVTPQIDQRVGEYLRAGDPFCVVADRRVMRARVLVPDRDLEDITVGAPASLQVNAYPLSSFEGTVRQILPAAALDHPVGRSASERRGQALYNYFAVTLELDNPSGRLIEGLTGTARLYGTRRPLALQALRSAWRWTRSRIWV